MEPELRKFDCSRYQSGHIADAWHETDDHIPTELWAMDSAWTGNDRTDTLSLHNTPDKKGYARCWCNNWLQGKKMSAVQKGVSTKTFRQGNGTNILWIGNQMAGSEINQKRKKHMKSLVVVPDDSGRLLAVAVWVSI